MDIIKIDTKKTRLISDGGCGYLEVDNSYNAFLASCNRMYFGVKADIRYTKDRVIVTSRDRDLKKYSNQKIHISLTNYNELKKVKLNNDEFTHITTLSVFLDLCIKYRKIPCIELHPPISNSELDKLLEIITKYGLNKKCKIISKDMKYLKYLRSKDLDLFLELRIKTFTDKAYFDAIKYHIDLVLPKNKLSKDLIDLCHENRINIGTTNIDDPVTALILSDMGIDFIYTVLLEEYKPN